MRSSGRPSIVGLVGLEVEGQAAVLDRLGLDLRRPLEQQMPQPGLDLDGVERGQAEVVVQVVAQLELGELRAVSSSNSLVGSSRLRSARHNAHAPSGSTSQATIAPAHPAAGSCAAASSAEATAFHR